MALADALDSSAANGFTVTIDGIQIPKVTEVSGLKAEVDKIELKQQTSEIHTQAASSTVSVEVLKEAFTNIYETIDTIDTFKTQAVDNMAVTVDALRTEITRAGEYLERQRAVESAPRP